MKTKSKLPIEFKLMLACCKFSLEGKDRNEIHKMLTGQFDWDSLIRESSYHQVAPIVYQHLNKVINDGGINYGVPSILRGQYLSAAVANIKFQEEFRQFVNKCIDGRIDIVGLRGIIFIHTLYKERCVRSMRDIDILVKKDDFPIIARLLKERGYQEISNGGILRYKLEYDCGTNFIKQCFGQEVIFNVHWSIASARPYRIHLPELWERTEKVNIDKVSIYALSKEDDFLALALHLRRHCKALALKYILDIKEFIYLYANTMDWQYIEKYSGLNHIRNVVYFALYISVDLLELTGIEDVKQKFSPGLLKRELISRTINKDNFFKRFYLRSIFLRLLLFDRIIDVPIYLWRVSFIERFFMGKILPLIKIKKSKKQRNLIAI